MLVGYLIVNIGSTMCTSVVENKAGEIAYYVFGHVPYSTSDERLVTQELFDVMNGTCE